MSADAYATPVTLEGDLARLEPLAAHHLDDLAAAGADPATWRWLLDDHSAPGRLAEWLDRTLETAATGRELPFATVERSTGRAVGSTRYMALAPEHRRLEIGWTWLAPSARGTGINAEAKLLALDHAFGTLGCRRVEFKTDALNERSRAALLAIGARFEGIFRRHMLMADGRSRDSAWYAIIDDDWPTVRERLQERVARFATTAGRGR
ncbi:MAG: hypothetical protein RL338_1648 [Chloroflexota bacterium]